MIFTFDISFSNAFSFCFRVCKENEKGEISEEESEEVQSDSDESYTTSSYQSTESPTVERRKKRKFQNFPWFTWTPDKCTTFFSPIFDQTNVPINSKSGQRPELS